jgi:transposase InsO family protein
MLNREGFKVNHKRVERIWREQGLKVAKRQKKRRRLWLNDGSCIRLRPEYRDHVWSYDIMEDKTHNGKKFRILNIMDEYTRECLFSFASRKITSSEVVEFLAELFCSRGLPEYIRSDNGSEFTARKVRKFIRDLGAMPTFIEPGSPWENGYIESFNGKMRDELLNREIFTTLVEAKVLINQWKEEYNQVRPHSSLGYRPPAPEAILTRVTR